MAKPIRGLAFLGAVAIGAACGAFAVTFVTHVPPNPSLAQERAAAVRKELAQATDLSQAFKLTAHAVRPSVVSISSVKKVRIFNPRQRQRPGNARGASPRGRA